MIDRRTALFLGAGLATFGSGAPGRGQEVDLPDLSKTMAFLESQRRMALLYDHFGFAYSLVLASSLQLNGVRLGNDDALNNFPIRRNEERASGISRDLWKLMGELQDSEGPGRRNEILQAMKEDGDPIEPHLERQRELVRKFHEMLAKFEVPPSSPIVVPAAESLTHVERIGAVALPQDDNASLICRVFPFQGSWLCS